LNKQFDYVHVRCNTIKAPTTQLKKITFEIFAKKQFIRYKCRPHRWRWLWYHKLFANNNAQAHTKTHKERDIFIQICLVTKYAYRRRGRSSENVKERDGIPLPYKLEGQNMFHSWMWVHFCWSNSIQSGRSQLTTNPKHK